jgi:hypothetical protein
MSKNVNHLPNKKNNAEKRIIFACIVVPMLIYCLNVLSNLNTREKAKLGLKRYKLEQRSNLNH